MDGGGDLTAGTGQDQPDPFLEHRPAHGRQGPHQEQESNAHEPQHSPPPALPQQEEDGQEDELGLEEPQA